MEISEFNKLPLDQKTNYLWDNGICLNQRLVKNQYIVCIFSLDTFYVEAVYSKRNNKVDRIAPINDLRKWEAYVDAVIMNIFCLS